MGTQFYESRGVRIHSLEVTRYACADVRTSEILEKIIQETTNRMNRLSQAESENEVKMFSMRGKIDQEKLNTELLGIQHQHLLEQAAVDGKAECDKAIGFLQGLKKAVPDVKERVEMWSQLRKEEDLRTVAQSRAQAQVFFTPQDVNLSINPNTSKSRERLEK